MVEKDWLPEDQGEGPESGAYLSVYPVPEACIADDDGYFLGSWHHRVHKLAGKKNLLDISREIGITRLLLAELMQNSPDAKTLIKNSRRILATVTKVSELVLTHHKLSGGEQTMDPENLENFVRELTRIVSAAVPDAPTLEYIATEMQALVGRFAGDE